MKKKHINNIDELAQNSVFGNESEKKTSVETIKKLAKEKGIIPSSMYRYYTLFANGKLNGFTVPAINIRTLTYDIARSIFRAAKRTETGFFIFEIARLETRYTSQSPEEYSVCVLAAAIREKYSGQVFLQGDHFQFSRKDYFESPDKEKKEIKNLIKSAVDAQIYNIDIDASTLVDIDKKSIREQQRDNFVVTAEMTQYIRSIQPAGITVTIGGEIGEIGSQNSTPDELISFMDGYNEQLDKKMTGLSKLSIQTGTTHGGTVLPDGNISEVDIDFETIKTLSLIARDKYRMAGVVQHGASTLPEKIFYKFPQADCLEIHLATGFQNQFFDSKYLPKDLRDEMYRYATENYKPERKKYATDEQFIYKTRKYALGPFKKSIWGLPEKIRAGIAEEIEEKIIGIFKMFRVNGTLRIIS